jgi:hypothetical protein
MPTRKSCCTSAPENGSVAGAPELDAGSLLEAPGPEAEEADEAGAEAAAGEPGSAPAAPVPDELAVEAVPLAGSGWLTTGKTTAIGPRPAELTARTRIEGLTAPILIPAMWQEPAPGVFETQL